MAEIVNLNKARKAKQRADRQAQAAANRRKFGRDKAEKARDALAASKAESLLDGAEREQQP